MIKITVVAVLLLAGVAVAALVWQTRARKSVADDVKQLVGVIELESGADEGLSTPLPSYDGAAKFRARSLANKRRFLPDLGEALRLDDATEQALYELINDQGISQSRLQDTESPAVAAEREEREDIERDALLGPGGARKLRAYFETVLERQAIDRINESAPAAARVAGEAKERLIRLLHNMQSLDRKPMFSYRVMPPETATSPRGEILVALAGSEDHFQWLQETFRRTEGEAAKFLTPLQLQHFKRVHADEEQGWLQSIASLRAQAGVDPGPARLLDTAFAGFVRRRVPVAGEIAFEMTMIVNGQPAKFQHRGANSALSGFQAAPGIWVDVQPILYDDEWVDVVVRYFEALPKGRRPLDGPIRIAGPSSLHESLGDTLTGINGTYQIRATSLTAQAIR